LEHGELPTCLRKANGGKESAKSVSMNFQFTLGNPKIRTTCYWAIVVFAALLRVLSLDRVPLGFWYDEAFYSLNALSIGRNHWPIFFVLDGHPAEPLFIYSLAAFFKLFGSTVFVARLHSAVWGTALVALMYPFAKRVVGERWALLACLVTAVFRWPLHFSRTVFRAILPPVFVLLVVIFFLRWREKRRLSDAVLCGASMGAGLYTYLSFRLVPLLWLGWVAWLWWRGEIRWRHDWRGLATIVFTCLIVFAPLGWDYLRNPMHFTGRMDEVSMFRKNVEIRQPDGSIKTEVLPKTPGEVVRDLASNAWAIVKMWTIRGDHVARHNLPHEPVFDWASGIVFYFGFVWCLWQAGRNEFAFLLPWWVVVFSLASVFSFGAPNILRMQGMIPAVVVIYVLGLRTLYELAVHWLRQPVRVLLISSLVVLFLVLQLDSYFRRFAQSPEMRREFLYDTFYKPALQVRGIAPQVNSVYVPADLGHHLTFRFLTHEVQNLQYYTVDADLPTTAPRHFAIVTTVPTISAAQERGRDLLAWLRRLRAEHHSTVPILVESATGTTEVPWTEVWVVR